MEDEGRGRTSCPQFSQTDLLSPLRSRVAYYGVFDGHAGSRASTYTAEHLHQNIKSCLPKGMSMTCFAN